MFKMSKEILENIKFILVVIFVYLFCIYFLFFLNHPKYNPYSYYGQKYSIFEGIASLIFFAITGAIIFLIYYYIKKVLLRIYCFIKNLVSK